MAGSRGFGARETVSQGIHDPAWFRYALRATQPALDAVMRTDPASPQRDWGERPASAG